jgi:hypothetical protein
MSFGLLVLALFLFAITEILDGYASPALFNQGRKYVICAKEEWYAQKVTKTVGGVSVVKSRSDGNFEGGDDPRVLQLAGGLVPLLPAVTPEASMGPFTYLTGAADGKVNQWEIRGRSTFVDISPANSGQPMTNTPPLICLPGFNSIGQVDLTNRQVVDTNFNVSNLFSDIQPSP